MNRHERRHLNTLKRRIKELEEERNDYRNQYHMAEAKVSSRDALLEQLSEEQLTKDVAKAEEENAAVKRVRKIFFDELSDNAIEQLKTLLALHHGDYPELDAMFTAKEQG